MMADRIQQFEYAGPLTFDSTAGALNFISKSGALTFTSPGTGIAVSTVDLTEALLWQHNMAPKLTALVKAKASWYEANHIAYWAAFIANTFDIRTCNQFGLIIWSIILNIPLHIAVPPQPQKPTFNFGTLPLGATWNQNFDNGNFGTTTGTVVSLTTDQQRILLLARYNQLTGKLSIPAINRFLKRVFGTFGVIYAVDSLDMTSITYEVMFTPSSAVLFMLTNTNVLPRPAGVGINVVTH